MTTTERGSETDSVISNCGDLLTTEASQSWHRIKESYMPSHISVFIKGKGYLVAKATERLTMQRIESYEPPRNDLDRFLSYVDQCERLDLCWNWCAGNMGMHGQFKCEGRSWPAHRWIYSLLFGEIPAGHVIHHRCHNKLCQNPVHLECMGKYEHWMLHRRLALAESLE